MVLVIFHIKWSVMQSSDDFFVVNLNKLLNKQSSQVSVEIRLLTAHMKSPIWHVKHHFVDGSYFFLIKHEKSTLIQVMAWCQMAPSHYPNQCWFFCQSHTHKKNILSIALPTWAYLSTLPWCMLWYDLCYPQYGLDHTLLPLNLGTGAQ